MRSLVAITMFVGGVVLAAVSYLWLAAPLGQPASEVYSNPRVLGAPTLFIVGIMVIFLAAVAYELWPDRARRDAP